MLLLAEEISVRLLDAGVITKEQFSPAVEVIKEWALDYAIEAWSVEDILLINPSLSVQQAREILERVEETYDASVGICWESLENLIEDYLG